MSEGQIVNINTGIQHLFNLYYYSKFINMGTGIEIWSLNFS